MPERDEKKSYVPLTPVQRERVRAHISGELGEGEVQVPLLRNNRHFGARVGVKTDRSGNQISGIRVNNLGDHNAVLRWEAFEAVLELLNQEDRDFLPGTAKGGPLGSDVCPLDSVEGYVARTVYGKQEGDHCFRRIAPLRGILLFCGLISRNDGQGGQGGLQLTELAKELLKGGVENAGTR